MMTAIITVAILIGLTILGAISALESYKEKEDNNARALEWAKKMESEHNVNVALYEDETGRIVDYEIYKL